MQPTTFRGENKPSKLMLQKNKSIPYRWLSIRIQNLHFCALLKFIFLEGLIEICKQERKRKKISANYRKEQDFLLLKFTKYTLLYSTREVV